MTAKQLKQRMLQDAFNERLTISTDGLTVIEQACGECQ